MLRKEEKVNRRAHLLERLSRTKNGGKVWWGRGRLKEELEEKLATEKTEVNDLKLVIEDLRGSLQLSDAQNLALQIMLKRMNKAEANLVLPAKLDCRNNIEKSEKQLENLIGELKEMSKMKYPTISSNHYSSTSSSYSLERRQEMDEVLNQELSQAQESLSGVQTELNTMTSRLKQTQSLNKNDSLNDAFEALRQAETEIQRMR